VAKHNVVEMRVRHEQRNNVLQIAIAKNAPQYNFIGDFYHLFFYFLFAKGKQ